MSSLFYHKKINWYLKVQIPHKTPKHKKFKYQNWATHSPKSY